MQTKHESLSDSCLMSDCGFSSSWECIQISTKKSHTPFLSFLAMEQSADVSVTWVSYRSTSSDEAMPTQSQEGCSVEIRRKYTSVYCDCWVIGGIHILERTHLKMYSRAWNMKARSSEQVWRLSACSRLSASSQAFIANWAFSSSVALWFFRIRMHPCHNK